MACIRRSDGTGTIHELTPGAARCDCGEIDRPRHEPLDREYTLVDKRGGLERIARGFRLSSGREFYANGGLISIARGELGLEVGQGYDGMLYGATVDDPLEESENWTPVERRELADYMIGLWSEYKAAARG